MIESMGEVQVIQTASDKGIAVVYDPKLRCSTRFVPVHLKFTWDNQLESIWETGAPINSLLVDSARIAGPKPDKTVISAKMDAEMAELQKNMDALLLAKEELSSS